MAAAGVSSTGREKLSDRCSLICPDLYDRATRLSWGLKLSMVLLHVIFVGVVFVFDVSLIRRTREEPWYTAAYLVVFSATLFQYFFTSCSSPGYVIDAMRAANGTSTTFNNLSSILKQSNSRDGYIICSMNNHHLEAQTTHFNSSSWLKLVMDLYPPGSAIRNWTCTYCNIVQPPRAKHCHDCDKCILQFDHHCVWLGTCVGQGNHCRFWWYVFLETILCIWTVVLYISYLRSETVKTWWKEFIVIVLLAALMFCLIFLILLLLFHSYLALTNQTTYEMVRRRRILYFRGIPEKVHPFSKGICKNLYTFCCSSHSIRDLEAVPTMEDIEASARPYTCSDIVMCRWC
ncbi:protein S-acyltransferase 10-like [Zingiber officinale]|uniref:protein S-acyltransferase 10-like n=1 Tax=Zingiber officinale TaxID=94328 RepID=UPI001C4C2181|nr:protein S-acyltransferase 10-like [Zingiber officinale]